MRILLLPALLLAVTTTAAAKEPRFVGTSTKTATDLAGCVALSLADARGYEITRIPRASGAELRLRFRVAGIAANAATFVIDDLPSGSRLTYFATGKSNGAPRTFARRTEACL